MSRAGPNSPTDSDDPFQRSFELVQGLALDTDDLEKFAEEVTNLPPDRRFTDSWDQFKEHLAPFFEKLFTTSDLSKDLIAGFIQMMAEQFTALQKNTLQKSRTGESPEDHLIAAVYIGELADVFEKITRNVDRPDIVEKLFSCYTALAARLVLIEKEDGWEITDAVVRDIRYSNYYSEKAVNRNVDQNPETVDIETLRHEILQQGAALAYTQLGMSIQEAAELAGLSVEEVAKEVDVNELPEFFLRGELIKQLNKTAIEKGISPGEILNQALETYLSESLQPAFEVNEDDPFFVTREEVIANFTGEGPETDASKLEDRLYKDPNK